MLEAFKSSCRVNLIFHCSKASIFKQQMFLLGLQHDFVNLASVFNHLRSLGVTRALSIPISGRFYKTLNKQLCVNY